MGSEMCIRDRLMAFARLFERESFVRPAPQRTLALGFGDGPGEGWGQA